MSPRAANGHSALVTSLATHAAPLAAALDRTLGGPAEDARRVLPDVLARGPETAESVLRHDLWLDRVDGLDAALRFVEEAQRVNGMREPAAAIPMPRRVFDSTDATLRDELLDFALAIWSGDGAEARAVTVLLHLILDAAGRQDAAPWRAALPHLHEDARRIWRRVGARHPAAPDGAVGDLPALVFIVLDACARWVGAGFDEAQSLARLLADRWPSSAQAATEWDPDHGDHNNLLVRLADDRVARLLALMRLPRVPRRHPGEGLVGFSVAAKHDTACAWIFAALDQTDLQARVLRLLERIGLLARLDPGLRAPRLFSSLDGAADATMRWPAWVRADEAARLTAITQAHTVATGAPGLPAVLQRVLARSDTMTRERAVLRARETARALSPAGRARLETLDRLATDPAAKRADLRRALDQALRKQWALSGLSALEAIVARALDRRWESAIGAGRPVPHGPAWDNALLMLESVTCNRRVLRRLLRCAAQGDHGWMLDLEPNRSFLRQLTAAGVDAAAWLAPHSMSIDDDGPPITVYVATDPLEVLQMGSLFGTCLSADRFNAHAAVAAAVEANKRVLYARDGGGRVIGRQLLAMTASGEILGFRCYGAGLDDATQTGRRVRKALARLAREIARACGATLMSGARVAEGLSAREERSLMLFCEGYVDTPIEFDA